MKPLVLSTTWLEPTNKTTLGRCGCLLAARARWRRCGCLLPAEKLGHSCHHVFGLVAAVGLLLRSLLLDKLQWASSRVSDIGARILDQHVNEEGLAT